MYAHATPPEYDIPPIHGANSQDAPRVNVTLHLELTQEEAAAALAEFSVGIRNNDPRVSPANVSQVLAHVLTDLTVARVREAALDMRESEEISAENAGRNAWFRHLVRPTSLRRNRQAAARELAGTAVA